MSQLYQNGALANERRYMGNGYEIHNDLVTGTGERHVLYIPGGNGICAIMVREADGPDNLYYPATDHLGSITALADETGAVKYEQSFDAWGRYRNPGDWKLLSAYHAPDPAFAWVRGYTGHEHLPQFALINMNARMYDPVLGRMLAPDNYITNGASTQAYNRYTYANNNPLKYTDPDGNISGTVIGMITAGASYAIQTGTKYGGWRVNWNWEQFGIAVFKGAVSGTVSSMIGGAFGAASGGPNGADGALHINNAIVNAGANALAHGIASYALSDGQSSAFYSSVFSVFVSSMGMEYGGTVLNSDAGSTIFSAGVGGVASEISGGNFWEGAATGALIHLTNQLQHRDDKDKLKGGSKKQRQGWKGRNLGKAGEKYAEQSKKDSEWGLSGGQSMTQEELDEIEENLKAGGNSGVGKFNKPDRSSRDHYIAPPPDVLQRRYYTPMTPQQRNTVRNTVIGVGVGVILLEVLEGASMMLLFIGS